MSRLLRIWKLTQSIIEANQLKLCNHPPKIYCFSVLCNVMCQQSSWFSLVLQILRWSINTSSPKIAPEFFSKNRQDHLLTTKKNARQFVHLSGKQILVTEFFPSKGVCLGWQYLCLNWQQVLGQLDIARIFFDNDWSVSNGRKH